MNEEHKQSFLSAVVDWVYDSYSLDIRYFAMRVGDEYQLLEATITASPVPSNQDNSFRIELPELVIGQEQRTVPSKEDVIEVLSSACIGTLIVHTDSYSLNRAAALDYHSEMTYRDQWFSILHLQITSREGFPSMGVNLAAIDDKLRRSNPPFDGIIDAAAWLGLSNLGSFPSTPAIKIRVLPPANIDIDGSKLSNDELVLRLVAHPKFDVRKIGVAIRVAPGEGLSGRKQVASSIVWSACDDATLQGIAVIPLKHADSALVMLSVGDMTVRRQWFLDPVRARNERLVAVHSFDKDLGMVRQAVLETNDSNRFEMGIAALAFLLGFSPLVQIETNSPDLIITTPGGKTILVECTLRVADFSTKLGKLVDRRRSLIKVFETSAIPQQVYAVLICGVARDQIAVRVDELNSHRVILITKDELNSAFDKVRFPTNPDDLLERAEKEFPGDAFKLA